ncbi:hypothetical protein B0I35DRAFT_477509 [Stachybotrys elegans]|uniref:Uncharacterized protein n=1 Tax=Stachybotrys elegans TaxID=80388 RepID=A0A8K0WTA6_9HYPO|nr:hypothetical protein B0I35DRAFT_477509 [Stachybotrys elegans]
MRLQTKRSSRAESTGRSWGFIATNIPDPPACISECRAQLLETLLQGDETMQRACELLSDTTFAGREEAVQALYCCDSQRCGVDHLGKPGQDPNVNWIINTCQNFGYVPIIDNGPPASDYLCSCASVLQPSACSGGTSSTPSVAIASAGSPSPDSTEQRHTSAAAASNHIQTASAQPEPTHSIVQSPSVAADSSQPSSQDGGGPQADLSAGVVVTIVMSTMVGIVLLAGLTIFTEWFPFFGCLGKDPSIPSSPNIASALSVFALSTLSTSPSRGSQTAISYARTTGSGRETARPFSGVSLFD